jgi:hypothetical protein
MSKFGSGSNSNGQFWYGKNTNFPGFLYKKNVGVGARRSTKMAPGSNTTCKLNCNIQNYLYNKYQPGGQGIGASSTSNRRAKNRLASVCNNPNSTNNTNSNGNCFPCYQTLGRYSNYTNNPNGYINCITNYPTILPTDNYNGYTQIN